MSIPGFDQAQARYDGDDGLGEFTCRCGCSFEVHKRDERGEYCDECDNCRGLEEW